MATINFQRPLEFYIFYSNFFVKTWNRRQYNINATNFFLSRKIAKSKFKTEDDALQHLFLKVVGYMFMSVFIGEK